MNVKSLITSICYAILLWCASCISRNPQNRSEVPAGTKSEQSSEINLQNTTDHPDSIDWSLLQGIWGENTADNALFKISGDVLIYTEDQNIPHKIIIENNMMIIQDTPPYSTKCTILKLDKDSLCFSCNVFDEVTRLIRR